MCAPQRPETRQTIQVALDDLLLVITRLRTECPWHVAQTAQSLVPYLREESFELAEAITAAHPAQLREELGDVFYQLLLHAVLLAEQPAEPSAEPHAQLAAVFAAAADKLRVRHPHVFADAGPMTLAELQRTWEQVKQRTNATAPRGVLDGIPRSLPALALAQKMLERAHRHGRVVELAHAQHPPIVHERQLGEALLGLVQAGRGAGLDAEQALRGVLRDVEQALERAE